MKITPQIIVLFLITSLVPIVILAGSFYLTSQKLLRDQVSNHLSSIAQVQEARIIDYLALQKDQTELIAYKTQLHQRIGEYVQNKRKNDLQEAEVILREAAYSVKNFRDIFVLDVHGDVLISINKTGIGKNFAKQEFFQKGKKATNATVFEKDTDGIFYYSTSPFTNDGRFIGMLVIKEEPKDFLRLFTNREGLGKTGEAYIAKRAENGDALYLTPLRFDENAMLVRRVNKNDSTFVINKALAKQEDAFSNSVDYTGAPVIAVSRYIDLVDWGLVVKIDQAEAYAPLSFILAMLGFVTSLSLILVVGIAIYFAHSITRPIIKLVNLADTISAGDLKKRIHLRSHDEIGQLGRAFNTMTEKLQDMYDHLEAKVQAKTHDIEEERKKLQGVLENIPVGVLLAKAPQGEAVFINKTGLHIFGHTFDGENVVTPDVSYEVVRKDGTLYPSEELPLTMTLRTKKSTTKSGIYLRDHTGVLRVALRVSSAPIYDETGEMAFVVVVFEDVTKEEEVDRMKTEFISLAAHQLRTPLTAIKWFTELLIDESQGKLNEAQDKYARNVNISTKRMINLVNALLNVSRLETGRIIIDSRPTNIKKLVEDVVDEIKVKFQEKKQTVDVSIDDLPEISVDPQMIRQVYLNLVINAIKYTPEGGHIELKVEKSENDVLSKIRDTGYGIPANEQKRVFEKFYRGENVVKTVTEGTGLGLYLVKAIVEASNGRVWFESTENKGTTFFFTIPLSGVASKNGEVGLS